MNAKSIFIVRYRYSRRAETLADEQVGRVILQYEEGLKSRWLTSRRTNSRSFAAARFLPGITFYFATSPMGTAHRVASQRASDRQADPPREVVHLPAGASARRIRYRKG